MTTVSDSPDPVTRVRLDTGFDPSAVADTLLAGCVMAAERQGTVVWITGLSGAGKTTVAKALAAHFGAASRCHVVLDGDVLRAHVLPTSTFSRDDRLRAAFCYGALCKEIAGRGVDVICATISLFHDVQRWNRRSIKRYVEVFLDVPMEILKQRDSKGIYSRAARGELRDVVGIDIAAEPPKAPDLRIENNGRLPETAVAEMVWCNLSRYESHWDASEPTREDEGGGAMTGRTVEWDYTALAKPYAKRPEYSGGGLDAMLAITRTLTPAAICDVGAGLGHLSIPLAKLGFTVTAIEPNSEMRRLGRERSAQFANIDWRDGTGEATGCPDGSYELVTFGSSFNVTDRAAALRETHRLLLPRGWFACMWNHRDLDDPLQSAVEAIIRAHLPAYDYGARREDQTPVIRASGLFETPYRIEAPVVHEVAAADWVEAWRSHATLARQAGERHHAIVDEIAGYLEAHAAETLVIPYTTRIWVARAKP